MQQQRPGRRGGSWLRLLFVLVLCGAAMLAATAVFAPWSYYTGGHFHPLPMWQGWGENRVTKWQVLAVCAHDSQAVKGRVPVDVAGRECVSVYSARRADGDEAERRNAQASSAGCDRPDDFDDRLLPAGFLERDGSTSGPVDCIERRVGQGKDRGDNQRTAG